MFGSTTELSDFPIKMRRPGPYTAKGILLRHCWESRRPPYDEWLMVKIASYKKVTCGLLDKLYLVSF